MDSIPDCKDRFHIIIDNQCLCDLGVPCDCCWSSSEIPTILSIPSTVLGPGECKYKKDHTSLMDYVNSASLSCWW